MRECSAVNGGCLLSKVAVKQHYFGQEDLKGLFLTVFLQNARLISC
jgi:hypothetical protein